MYDVVFLLDKLLNCSDAVLSTIRDLRKMIIRMEFNFRIIFLCNLIIVNWLELLLRFVYKVDYYYCLELELDKLNNMLLDDY